MIIKYIGHACFKIRDNETGYSIIFDPYQPDSVPGFAKIIDIASEVRCSHDHYDHNSVDSVTLEPKVDCPFTVETIDTWHDSEKGAKRGPNRITVIKDRSGTKVIHYGDVGEVIDDLLSEKNLALLKDADVALIPVGGMYTYDADQAIELIHRTSPKVAIPMHFRLVEGIGFAEIGTLEEFLNKAHSAGNRVVGTSYTFYDTETPVQGNILAVKPQNAKLASR
ncbi:MAG: MBL fold metallo-hydrolase [Bacillota bacterium]|nr:MBL fold metallo-hydrolase [Bacillota bacterium]